MSTHSGFGTKKEEETYNQLVFNVLYLVQLRLSSFYRLESGLVGQDHKMKDSEDLRLRQTVEKHYQKMIKMEKVKYLAPRFSEALKDISVYLGCYNEPKKEVDLLSKEETERDAQTSDSHFSGFSRFSTTNRPSGFALSPSPQREIQPRMGNAGSTNSNLPFQSKQQNLSSTGPTQKGKQNIGMTQKADQKGGNDSKFSKTLSDAASHLTKPRVKQPVVLDVIVESQGQFNNPENLPQEVSVTQKHASEIGYYDNSVQHKTAKANKRRSKTQVIPIEQDVYVTEKTVGKEGGLKEEIEVIKEQLARQPKRQRRVIDQKTLQQAKTDLAKNDLALDLAGAETVQQERVNTQVTPVAKASTNTIFNSAKHSHSVPRQHSKGKTDPRTQQDYKGSENGQSQNTNQRVIILQKSSNVVNHFSIGQINSDSSHFERTDSRNKSRDFRNQEAHYQTLPALPRGQNEPVEKISRGEQQRREIEKRRDDLNMSDTKRSQGQDRKSFLVNLESEQRQLVKETEERRQNYIAGHSDQKHMTMPPILSQITLSQSQQSDLPMPDLKSGLTSQVQKVRSRIQKQNTVERSESIGKEAMYISKGGVTLNSNALTEVALPNSILAKKTENFARADPIKIDMNPVEKLAYKAAENHGQSGDTGTDNLRGSPQRDSEVEVKLVSTKPYNPLDMPFSKQVAMPKPIYVNADSSYNSKRSMVKKYVASAARFKKMQSPLITGSSFFSVSNQQLKLAFCSPIPRHITSREIEG